MLCDHLHKKIMGGNEHDYRVAAEVWKENKDYEVYAISYHYVLLYYCMAI